MYAAYRKANYTLSGGTVKDSHQMSLRIPKSDHLAARIKALQDGIELSEVVRRLLALWVAGAVVLEKPDKKPDKGT